MAAKKKGHEMEKEETVALNARISPTLHRAAMRFRADHGMTLNEQVVKALEMYHAAKRRELGEK